MYLKLAEIYLFQEPKIPRPNYVLRFCVLSGLSGTSFTGYPLPDVAAGINLKNQVPPIIMVVFGCFWNQLFRNHFQGQIFKKDLFGKESATGRNLRKRMSGSVEVDIIEIRYNCSSFNSCGYSLWILLFFDRRIQNYWQKLFQLRAFALPYKAQTLIFTLYRRIKTS